MSNKILHTILFVFAANQVFAQGNYRNVLPLNSTPSSTVPVDIETITNHILITGLTVTYNSNPNQVPRIFLTKFKNNSVYPFNRLYLQGVQDVLEIDPSVRFDVKEVKECDHGYILCGNIKEADSANNYDEGFVLRTDLNGICQWAKRYTIDSSVSVYFNSISPCKTNGAYNNKYVVCGYRQIANDNRKAIVTYIDSLGSPIHGVWQLNESLINGHQQSSEYKKVIYFKDNYCALTGYCGQLGDSCFDVAQSGILFSMYELGNDVILSKAIHTLPNNNYDYHIDEGVSLVKTDSCVMVLAKYDYRGNIHCGSDPDYQAKLVLINPVNPSNITTWTIVKTLRYNLSTAFSQEEMPRDLLYVTGSPNHLWIYGNYQADLGYLLHMNFNTATNLTSPMIMNNNVGYPNINGTTIDYNTAGHVVGLTDLYAPEYSLFEVTPSQGWNCFADSMINKYYLDSLIWTQPHNDSLVLIDTEVPIITDSLHIHDSVYCDSVWAKPSRDVESSQLVLTVYPNPASEIIHIAANIEIPANSFISLVDLMGRRIILRKIEEPTDDYFMDVSSVKNGSYFIVVEHDGVKNFSEMVSVYRNK